MAARKLDIHPALVPLPRARELSDKEVNGMIGRAGGVLTTSTRPTLNLLLLLLLAESTSLLLLLRASV